MTAAPVYRSGTPPCKAVLMLHGILSAPQFFRFLLPAIPRNAALCAPLLLGHGQPPRALSLANMQQWKAQARTAFLAMRRKYGSVHIAAHSMGTLFAIALACEFPEDIPEMLLLNVPLYPRLTLSAAVKSLAIAGNLPQIDRQGIAMQNAFSVSPSADLSAYLGWIPRYLELFDEMAAVRSGLDGLHVPCTAFYSRRDELVSPRSAILLRAQPEIRVLRLQSSTHFYYSPFDSRRIRAAAADMLRAVPASVSAALV